jgi:hypothetical protein
MWYLVFSPFGINSSRAVGPDLDRMKQWAEEHVDEILSEMSTPPKIEGELHWYEHLGNPCYGDEKEFIGAVIHEVEVVY